MILIIQYNLSEESDFIKDNLDGKHAEPNGKHQNF